MVRSTLQTNIKWTQSTLRLRTIICGSRSVVPCFDLAESVVAIANKLRLFHKSHKDS